MFMRMSLPEYLSEYAGGHTQLGTKITHMIGIPLIVASLPTLLFNPFLGGALFVIGWIFQLVGHWVFEKNSPSFAHDPFFLLVGPIWTALEFAELFGIKLGLTTGAGAQ